MFKFIFYQAILGAEVSIVFKEIKMSEKFKALMITNENGDYKSKLELIKPEN